MIDFAGWTVELWMDEENPPLSPSEQDDLFNELPSSQDIALAIAAFVESRYQVRIHDAGFSDFGEERGKM